jgi:hypothetical protein
MRPRWGTLELRELGDRIGPVPHSNQTWRVALTFGLTRTALRHGALIAQIGTARFSLIFLGNLVVIEHRFE